MSAFAGQEVRAVEIVELKEDKRVSGPEKVLP